MRTSPARTIATTIVATVLATFIPLLAPTAAHAAKAKTITIADAAIIEGNSGSQSLVFKVSWTGPKGGAAVSVSYATSDGTATAGSDYTAKSGTIPLPNGCRCNTISIPILGDTLAEGTETFTIDLSAPVNANIVDGHAVGTIFDNEGAPTFVVLDASAAENAGPLSFDVWLTTASASPQSVDYATLDGTALADGDYTRTSGTLNFPAGATKETVTVPLLDDATNEADETFSLHLSNGSLTLGDAEAAGTISDDDPEPTLSVGDATVAENAGPSSFTISLSAVSGQEVDVDYTTTAGSATAGEDYTTTSGTAVILAGQTSAQVDVPLLDDATYEPDEGLTLDLTNPSTHRSSTRRAPERSRTTIRSLPPRSATRPSPKATRAPRLRRSRSPWTEPRRPRRPSTGRPPMAARPRAATTPQRAAPSRSRRA